MSGPFPSGHKVFNTELNPMLLGWIDFTWFGSTLAYVSADAPTFVFSVNADVTGLVEPGMRVKLTQTTDKFFIVTAVGAYAAGVTPITVYGGTDYVLANAAITAGSFSTHKKPYGFNASPIKWREELRDTTLRTQTNPVNGTWYNPGALSLSLPIGAWRVFYSAMTEGDKGSPVAIAVKATLSTANNSESDSDFTAIAVQSTSGDFAATLTREKHVVVAAKTPYFLNALSTTASISDIYFGDSSIPTIIRAVCAYL